MDAFKIAEESIKNGEALLAELKTCIEKCVEQDAEIVRLKGDAERLNAWVNDLQSGMYINCVYCGHCYGPQDKVPCSMAEALKKHIEQCPKHPMSALKQDLAACRKVIEGAREWLYRSEMNPYLNIWDILRELKQLLPEARGKE